MKNIYIFTFLILITFITVATYFYLMKSSVPSLRVEQTDSETVNLKENIVDTDLKKTEMASGTNDVVVEESVIKEVEDGEEDFNQSVNQSDNMTNKSEIKRMASGNTNSMLVAGGCFWCVEADLEKLGGVAEAVSGYAGGSTENPTYENYQKGGHREVVRVDYDPGLLTFEEILIYAIKHMDPTDGEGSFYDRGLGYAPALYYKNQSEKETIEKLIGEINEFGPYEKPLQIAVLEEPVFYVAENYHQDYYKGTLSSLKYKYYRNASGRDSFIEKHWGSDTGPTLSWRSDNQPGASDDEQKPVENKTSGYWQTYQKPDKELLRQSMGELAFKVTQEEGTERAFTSPYDKFWEEGIYVDILSGEPLFSSKDKFDSGTGWPSFVGPITPEAVTEHEDYRLFSKRIEIRSSIADNHLGHVFTDGPKDKGGLRYCMNGVALRFVPRAEMVAEGYQDYLDYL